MRINALITALACCLASLGADPADPDPLAKLLTRYQELDLPMPPPEARLAIHRGSRSKIGENEWRQNYYIGFIESSGVWLGTEKIDPTKQLAREWQTIEPEAAAKLDITPDILLDGFTFNTAIATAIQCQARGYHQLATPLYRSSLEHPRFFRRIPADDGGFQPPSATLLLSEAAWNHWALIAHNSPLPDRLRRGWKRC